jgi:hypothetical protein
MKAKNLITVLMAIGACLLIPAKGSAQVITNESQKVLISPTENSPITIQSLSPPFGPYASFKISCENKSGDAIKATVLCDLVFLKEGKEVYDAFSFHDLKVPTGISTSTVVFAALNLKLKGEGKLKVYLADRVAPEPKPPRAVYMAIGGEVSMLDKPIGDVYKQLPLHLISNTLLLPSKTE